MILYLHLIQTEKLMIHFQPSNDFLLITFAADK